MSYMKEVKCTKCGTSISIKTGGSSPAPYIVNCPKCNAAVSTIEDDDKKDLCTMCKKRKATAIVDDVFEMCAECASEYR